MSENAAPPNQQTIRRSARVEGVGLHTGKRVRVEFKPAPPNSGITFLRTDLSGSAPVTACVTNILDASRRLRRTSIGNGIVEVHVQKIRFREVGKPGMVQLHYHPTTGRFSDLGGVHGQGYPHRV